MKKIIIWLIVLFVFLNKINMAFSESRTYCMGWQKGFVQGWCYQDLNCITPIVPVCPLPMVQFNTYKDGYADGFLAGKKKRKDENRNQ